MYFVPTDHLGSLEPVCYMTIPVLLCSANLFVGCDAQGTTTVPLGLLQGPSKEGRLCVVQKEWRQLGHDGWGTRHEGAEQLQD